MSSYSSRSPSRQRIFGPFVFDEDSGELRKHGVRMRLQGQPLQILAALTRQPGSLITRDEFQQQLWSGAVFVDFDHGLNAAMNRLRQALGDSADHPRYIETLPGRGYRFIASIQDATTPDTVTRPVLVMPPAPESNPVPAAAGKFSPRWLIAAVMVVSSAGVYLAAIRPNATATAPVLRFSISPPDGYALEAGSSRQTFALSPDGKRLAFSAMDASGVFQAFVRDLDALDSRPVPNARGAYHVFWAPDGRSVFLTVAGTVRRYPMNGDAFQVLCDTPAIMLTGALMGPNLLISSRLANFVAPESGGTPKRMNELYPWPQVLPDGKHVLYSVFDAKSGHHRASIVEMGNHSTARGLVETDSRTLYAPSLAKPGTGYLVYVRAGNLLAHPFDPLSLQLSGEPMPVARQIYSFFPTGAADFSVSNNGMLAYRRYMSRSQFAWVDRHGQILERIGPANVNLKEVRLSPDGKKIAAPIFNVDRGVTEMWIIDAVTGAARRTAAGPGIADNPVWAPDSNRLAWSHALLGPPELYMGGIGENDTGERLPEGFFQVPTDWSRDGRFIAFTNTTFSQVQSELLGDVWLIDMARHRKVIHLISTPFHESDPAFSPDGRWLAFVSNESGRAEVYIQPFEAGESPHMTGERYVVSRGGATSVRWRRDGKELFYLASDGRIYAVPVTLAAKPEIGAAVPLFPIGMEARAAIHGSDGFDVSADGQQFLVPVITSSEKSEIVVIQNWEAQTRRKSDFQ
jgi:Tol biopolymer transport system component/DNA-binding winged helix-turn-helix (wHTH) protein